DGLILVLGLTLGETLTLGEDDGESEALALPPLDALEDGETDGLILALGETLALGEYDTQSRGGARIVSANVAGKQFSYELPPNWSNSDFTKFSSFLP
ncbi:MAG: hypothetical protein EBX03_14535, partial [Rhodobacteraceae bacterium]|nr:hypothetical protein [Paracoccaceae bacterium]